MNRETCFRSLAVALVMAACALFAPRTVHAQDAINCRCDSINVVNNSNCSATICLSAATFDCHTIPPNTAQRIPCHNALAIGIRDCHGVLHQLSAGCIDLAIAPGCCVRVCLLQAATGCYTVTINQSGIVCLCD